MAADGSAPVAVDHIEISDAGVLSAVYANGTRAPSFRIPIASVPSPDKLSAISGNAFLPSNESGDILVGLAGSGSYQPNPVQTGGNQVMFKNSDTVNTHRIVMDDGSADFGTLAPGASSAARSVSGGNFHCTIHPSMVGSVNGATAPSPAPGSGDGY